MNIDDRAQAALDPADPQVLMAYADGELAAADAARVEAAIAVDPALARIVDDHRALRARLSDAFAGVLLCAGKDGTEKDKIWRPGTIQSVLVPSEDPR